MDPAGELGVESLPSGWRTVGAPQAADGVQAASMDGTSHRLDTGGSPLALRAVLVGGAVVAVAVASAVAALVLFLTAPGGSVAVQAGAGDSSAPVAHQAGGILVRTGVPSEALESPPAQVVVDVEGAVRNPGVHHLAPGSRLADAIAAAGGYSDRADVQAAAQALNLAQPLADGAKVRVPAIGDTAVPAADGTAGPASASGAALIDVNHADEAALDSLPGIGPVTAGKIIAARSTQPFASVDDLQSRGVVPASTLEKIRALITVTP